MNSFNKIFFLEVGVNHFGKTSYANRVLNFFLKSNFQNLTFMIHLEKFYKKFEKKGINFKLSNKFYSNIINYCKKRKKKFGFSVCDVESFKHVSNIKVDFYKLLSVGIDNKELIKMLKKKNKPIYISTGFNSSEKKIKNCIRLFGKSKNLKLLHSPMTYNPEELNLNKINIYKKIYKLPVGFSNHFNDKEIFKIITSYNPDSIFIYCKPIKKKERTYPDDQHAFYLDELQQILMDYNETKKMHSTSSKKRIKVNIFKNEIKL